MTKFRQRGQITLLAVILGVLGLTLGLSVASRSLSDLRQASTVDFGTKALAAAESGVEYGLAQISLNPNFPANQLELVYNAGLLGNLTQIGIETLKLDVSRPVTGFARSDGVVAKDDVFQVDFTAAAPTADLVVYWTGAPGVEIAALYGPAYTISRYAYRQNGQLGSSNFTGVAGGSGCDGENYDGVTSSVPRQSGVNSMLLLRVKPVGGPGEICVSGGTIPSQYYEVTATATTTNGTVKKVRVRRDVSGTLPGIFDNVLYSGGSISK